MVRVERILMTTIVSIALLATAGCAGSPAGKLLGNYTNPKTRSLLDGKVGRPVAEVTQWLQMEPRSYTDMFNKGQVVHSWILEEPTGRHRFVKTGTEYVGTSMVGMTRGGNGVAAAPIHQAQYRDVGYNQATSYVCIVNINTDEQGAVLHYQLTGDYCDRFLFPKDG